MPRRRCTGTEICVGADQLSGPGDVGEVRAGAAQHLVHELPHPLIDRSDGPGSDVIIAEQDGLG